MSSHQSAAPNASQLPDVSHAAELRRRNLRLALILASVVAVFFFGFVTKMVLLSQHH